MPRSEASVPRHIASADVRVLDEHLGCEPGLLEDALHGAQHVAGVPAHVEGVLVVESIPLAVPRLRRVHRAASPRAVCDDGFTGVGPQPLEDAVEEVLDVGHLPVLAAVLHVRPLAVPSRRPAAPAHGVEDGGQTVVVDRRPAGALPHLDEAFGQLRGPLGDRRGSPGGQLGERGRRGTALRA